MQWKDIPGYEGIYEACEDGRIRTKEGKVTDSARHGRRVWKQRVLKQKVSKDNTCRVELYKNKKGKTWLVHRLIALTFIPLVEGKDYINHLDGNRLNNEVSNLEWCDHKENNNHAFDNNLMTSNKKVILVNMETGEPFLFRSLAKGSEFLGKNHRYLSKALKDGRNEVSGHEIYLKVD
ncbi:NUMOD4 domain-containing protein [Sporosarcina contaminans]|uniref:NUMOD4 domain-containing protein n=1 Tax=Sporosarcina contaminans TaxID=633403 RepID=A0ABW3TYG4_9BACL